MLASDDQVVPNLSQSLQRLPLFDNVFLGMQAQNIGVVDLYIRDLEKSLYVEFMNSDKDKVNNPLLAETAAFSQMWVFALYELLRTWRQQVRELLKFGDELAPLSGDDREARIEEERDRIDVASSHLPSVDEDYRASFERIASDADFVGILEDANEAVTPLFRQVEALRMSLAKHEVPKRHGKRAFMPGYTRMDILTGSPQWQVVLGDGNTTTITRRQLSDQLAKTLQ